LIRKEKKERLVRIYECLKTKPFHEGINGMDKILSESYARGQLKVRWEIIRRVAKSTIKWLVSLIKSLEPSDEREMRINELLVVCFIMGDNGQECLERYVKFYAAPFLAKPGYTKIQIIQAIRDRIYQISQNEGSELLMVIPSEFREQIRLLDQTLAMSKLREKESLRQYERMRKKRRVCEEREK